MRQLPSTAAITARSARDADRRLRSARRARTARSPRRRPALDAERALADGRERDLGERISVARSPQPSRLSPASASTTASTLPSLHLAQPGVDVAAQRLGAQSRAGPRGSHRAPQARGADARARRQLSERLPRAGDQRVARILRGGTHASARPGADSAGTSLIEWTAKCARPSSSASSSSLMKRPLPPMSWSGLSWVLSPEVTICSSSTVEAARRPLERAGERARLGEGERGAAGGEDEAHAPRSTRAGPRG